ncbi:unnamed protein product [Mucor hiemalis]
MAQQIERNQEATIYIGNLNERCTESLVWELMLQAGPVVNVHLPKDRVTQTHQSYGFVEFLTEEDADYAIKIMNQVRLYGKPIRVNKATSDKKNLDVGATLFIGNLDPEISRDPETGGVKGFGFISFDNFELANAAIDAMEGQYLMNKQITVSYAFKKDGKGEKHGSSAERLLAAEARKNVQLPNRLYSGGPAMAPALGVGVGSTPAPNYAASFPRPPPPPPPMGGPAGYPARPPPMGYPPQQQYGMPPPPPPQWQ